MVQGERHGGSLRLSKVNALKGSNLAQASVIRKESRGSSVSFAPFAETAESVGGLLACCEVVDYCGQTRRSPE